MHIVKQSIIVFSALVLPIAGAWAQVTNKVGIVNVPRLLKESKMAQAASKRLEQEFGKREQELQKIATTITQMQDSLEKNAVTMSDAERKNKEKELTEQNREFQKKQREFREDVERRQSEETSKIVDKAQGIINKLAVSGKYDLILRDAVYASPKVDLTERVLRELTE